MLGASAGLYSPHAIPGPVDWLVALSRPHALTPSRPHALTPSRPHALTQIKALSVKEVTSPVIFDNLKNAVIGGLYDPAFGPMDAREKCKTCGLNSYECPGHFGHVEVSVPLYNPLVFATLYKVLRVT